MMDNLSVEALQKEVNDLDEQKKRLYKQFENEFKLFSLFASKFDHYSRVKRYANLPLYKSASSLDMSLIKEAVTDKFRYEFQDNYNFFLGKFNKIFAKKIGKKGFSEHELEFMWYYIHGQTEKNPNNEICSAYIKLKQIRPVWVTIVNKQIKIIEDIKNQLETIVDSDNNLRSIISETKHDLSCLYSESRFFETLNFRFRGVSRRQFFKFAGKAAAGFAIGMILLDPLFNEILRYLTGRNSSGLQAAELKDVKFITHEMLELEHKYRKYLGIPAFDLAACKAECTKIIEEMVNAGKSGKYIQSITDKKLRESEIKKIFRAYGKVLTKNFRKISADSDPDQFSISKSLRERYVDCDIMSYFCFDAGTKSGNPIFFVICQQHALVVYQYAKSVIFYETTYAANVNAQMGQLLGSLMDHPQRQKILRDYGFNPQATDEHHHEQLEFPNELFLIRFRNKSHPTEKILFPESLDNGVFLHLIHYEKLRGVIIAKFSSSIFDNMSNEKKDFASMKISKELAQKSIKIIPNYFLPYSSLAEISFDEALYYQKSGDITNLRISLKNAVRYAEQAFQRHPGAEALKNFLEGLKEAVNSF